MPPKAAAAKESHAASILKPYHERPDVELYHLAADPHEQHNLAGNKGHAKRLSAMRTDLEEWMKRQGDKQTVTAPPRLMCDPNGFGTRAPLANVSPKAKPPEPRS